MPVQFSRGCPFQCEFSATSSLSTAARPRTKASAQIISELDKLREHSAGAE